MICSIGNSIKKNITDKRSSLGFFRFRTTSTSAGVNTGGAETDFSAFFLGFFVSRLGACPLGISRLPVRTLSAGLSLTSLGHHIERCKGESKNFTAVAASPEAVYCLAGRV